MDENVKSDGRSNAALLALVVVLGIALRAAAVALWGQSSPDAELIRGWCVALARHGVTGFFTGFDVPMAPAGLLHPLFAVLLWPLGVVWQGFDPGFAGHASTAFALWVRVPSVVAELVATLAVWRVVRRFAGARPAALAAASFFLNPLIILGCTVWGHSDALILALVLGGLSQIIEGRHALGLGLVGAAGLAHVHACVLLPVAVVVVAARGGTFAVVRGLVPVAVVGLILARVMSPEAPLQLYLGQPAAEPYTTYGAFNAWFPLGNLEPGEGALVPKAPGTRHTWGLAALMLLTLVGIVRASSRADDQDLLRETLLVALGAWLFGTRMHARYAVYAVGLLALFPAYRPSLALLSIGGALNVIWAMGLGPNWGAAVMGGWGNFLAALNLVIYLRLGMGGAMELTARDDEAPDGLIEAEEEAGGVVSLDRYDLAVMLILLLAFGFLRHVNLAAPPDTIFDEVYHAKAADEIWRGKAPNEWVHPPLAKMLIGLGIQKFGMNSYGWRFIPWLFGCFVLPMFYVLARNVIFDRRCAVIGTLLFAFDGCYFVLSRTAMTNVFATMWQVSAITCFLLYLKQASRADGRLAHGGWLLVTGVLCGLGVSTRWTCLWLIAFVSGLYALHTTWHVFWKETHTAGLSLPQKGVAYLFAALSGLVHFYLIPGAMYLAAYFPLVKSGAYPDYDYVVSLQPQIWHFHTTFTTHHPYYSQWYTWCFTYRPVWYHYKDVEGMVHGILALGNPILWWISMPGVIAAAWMAVRERSWMAAYACVSWGALYIPWILSPRVLNYSHYYLEPLPYACLALAWMAAVLCRRDKSFWVETTATLLVVAASFAFFYPIYSCTPVPKKTYDLRIWSRTWI